MALVFTPSGSEAGTTGKIAGRIRDAESGEPLPSANVQLAGSRFGSATDGEGRFVILNVPPGTYELTAHFIGFASGRVRELSVHIDRTCHIDLELRPTVLSVGAETLVIADREYFQKDLTASQSIVDASLIQDTPATELNDILQLQAGVTVGSGGDFHFRGGRSGETAFLVDGVSFTDAVSGQQAVAVENQSIQEIQVITGAFNAEYGQAMSGVVNIVTKEGSDHWSGSAAAYGGDFISGDNELFWGIDERSPRGIQNLQFTVSGPVAADRLHLFASGRHIRSDGYLYGRNRFNFYDVADFQPLDASDWQAIATGDSALAPMNSNRKYSGQAKLTFQASAKLKLRYNLLLEDSEGQGYDHYFRLNPSGRPTHYKTGAAHTFTGTYTIGARALTFLELGVSSFRNHNRSYVFEDPEDPRYYFVTFLDNAPPHGYSYVTGGVRGDWTDQQTRTSIIKVDLTSQLNYHNLVKLGLETRSHAYSNLIRSTVERGGSGEIEYRTHQDFQVSPVEMSAYLQDKFEADDLVLNIGIRLDRFHANGSVPVDPRDPSARSPIREFFEHPSGTIVGFREVATDFSSGLPVYEHQELEAEVPWDDPRATELRRRWVYRASSPQYQISPRVGLSYPITDRGGIHLSYGHFFQMPNLGTIYSNPEWELGDGVGVTSLMGNPDIEAQKTVSYEIGIQQQIGDAGRLTCDLFFRDFRNLLASDRLVESHSAGKFYAQYNNRDQGNARGLAVAFGQDSEYLYWGIDYTFQIAEGLASDPADAFRRLASNREPLPQLVPLNWDRRHTLNLNASAHHSIGSVSAVVHLWSPTPYTPETETIGAAVENGGRLPAYYNLDLKARKTISFAGWQGELFVDIRNVLDRRNELFVYADTGRATESLDELKARELSTEFVNTVDSWFSDPSRFSAPREVHAGLALSY